LSQCDVLVEHGQQADRFNRECQCVTLDRRLLQQRVSVLTPLLEERPQLFADSVVFVDEECLRRQADIIAAVERTLALPTYQERVLLKASPVARFTPKAHSVFFSYDFHLDKGRPRLIEINTNAGGALLNVCLMRAQKSCLHQTNAFAPFKPDVVEQAFLAMFRAEWFAERGNSPLRSIAIVDDNPEIQFLLPEFLLFQRLFAQYGIEAVICDPRDLVWSSGTLWFEDLRIDLVYNRLTDFDLAAETNASLREAYLQGAVVLTPHPHAYALYANKRNLAVLTDADALQAIGVNDTDRALLLNGIAPTVLVLREDADSLWLARKRLFFKPVAGYGGKGAYRGDKLTRRVFEEILQGDYVAQTFVSPGDRLVQTLEGVATLKYDLRAYVYCGVIQLVVARLYQGQTTNFRTVGGGFAPVRQL
jgi:hypothetical protein